MSLALILCNDQCIVPENIYRYAHGRAPLRLSVLTDFLSKHNHVEEKNDPIVYYTFYSGFREKKKREFRNMFANMQMISQNGMYDAN